MENNEEKLKIEKAKKISIYEGSSCGIMDGFGTRYITPYALVLKAPNYAIGILSSLPALLGNLGQLLTLRLMGKHSRKKVVFTVVLLQTLLWLPIIAIGLSYYYLNISSTLAIFLLIFIYTLLTGFGNSASPSWNSWMKDLVTTNKGSYFGNRNRIINIITIISMLIAGIILNFYETFNPILGFSIIFFIAFLGRLVSTFFIYRQYEPEFKFEDKYYFNIFEFTKKIYKNNFGKFVIFVSLISLGTAIASPFFSVFMLKELDFDYLSYTIIILTPIVSTIIFLPFWGRYGDKVGNVKVMKITGLFIPLVPIPWILSIFILRSSLSSLLLPYLIFFELFSGFIWAGFNLSAANFLFDAVSRQRMAICAAYYNFINTIGTFIGASLGGIIASINFNLAISSLIIVFILSTIIRFVFYLLMIKKIKEVRDVENLRFEDHLKKEFIDQHKKVRLQLHNFSKIFTFKTDISSPVQIDNYSSKNENIEKKEQR
jgi:MFS family permease